MTLFPTNSVLVWIASFEIRVNVCHLSPYWFLFGLLSLACRGLTTPQNNNFKFFCFIQRVFQLMLHIKRYPVCSSVPFQKQYFWSWQVHSFTLSLSLLNDLKLFFARLTKQSERGPDAWMLEKLRKQPKRDGSCWVFSLNFKVKLWLDRKAQRPVTLGLKK